MNVHKKRERDCEDFWIVDFLTSFEWLSKVEMLQIYVMCRTFEAIEIKENEKN